MIATFLIVSSTRLRNDVCFLSFSDSKCCWVDTLQSKNTKLWSFSIKFDELLYNNVNNTFTKNGQMARQPSSLLLSPHIVKEPCCTYLRWSLELADLLFPHSIFEFVPSTIWVRLLILLFGCFQWKRKWEILWHLHLSHLMIQNDLFGQFLNVFVVALDVRPAKIVII